MDELEQAFSTVSESQPRLCVTYMEGPLVSSGELCCKTPVQARMVVVRTMEATMKTIPFLFTERQPP